MILKVTKSTDPVWKKKFVDVVPTDPNLKRVVADMQETLTFTMGVGLAAPQIGYPWRMFIIDYADLKETFIDPKIIKRGEKTNPSEEGCLSIPGYRGTVARSDEIEMEFTNLSGKRQVAQLSGYYAKIAQHEYDHLSSTFYTDRIKNKNRDLYHFEPIRIVFFGTSEFSGTILKSLVGQMVVGEYEIPLVITAPDKPAGRGQKVTESPVKQMAREFNLPVLTPEKLAKKENDKFKLINIEVYEAIKKAKPLLLVLASYGKILPKEILDLPKVAPLNVHPSLLPKYRGPSPIQTAILKGDKYTGVTIMKMNEKMDEGDIYLRGRYETRPDETAESLSKILADISLNLLHHVIHYVVIEGMKTKPQKSEKATYTKIIKKEDSKVDWKAPPKNLERMIRAYYPWPGVWTEYNGKVLKLLPKQMVQLEGKNPVSLKNFKSGHKDFTLSW